VWLVVAVVVAVVAAGLAAGVLVSRGGSSPAGASVALLPAGFAGADPFSESVAIGPAVEFPGKVQAVAVSVRKQLRSDPKTQTLVAVGTTPGLYGGSGEVGVCDPEAVVRFLAGNPDKAAAWAGVLGIAAKNIGSYVATLTPVVLTSDTLVTNHGYRDGQATSLPSVLEAGTAVLVDRTGTPRVKCNCGNPLTEPAPIPAPVVASSAVPWPEYDPTAVTVVRPGTTTTTLTLIDIHTGDTYTQTTGSISEMADGTYTISMTPDKCGVGAGALNGQSLVVQGDHATISLASGEEFAGAVERHGTTFHISTELAGSTFSIDFTGTVSYTGDIVGTYVYSGKLGSGEIGVNCSYGFTGHLETTSPSSTTTPIAVAKVLFAGVDLAAGHGECGGGGDSYAACPTTPELREALTRFSTAERADALCRCQNTPPTIVYAAGRLPDELRGKRGYNVVDVGLGFNPPYTVSVLLARQPDGAWLAADTYCAAVPGDQDPYANRMTASPHSCVGDLSTPTSTAKSAATSDPPCTSDLLSAALGASNADIATIAGGHFTTAPRCVQGWAVVSWTAPGLQGSRVIFRAVDGVWTYANDGTAGFCSGSGAGALPLGIGQQLGTC
jgi:hypothetical protein